MIPVGTADDPSGKSGLASLTATLLDKGTRSKTHNELVEELDALVVSLSTGPSVDSTSVSFSVLSRNLAPTLSLVGQILTAPRFDPEDFDRERKLELDGLPQGSARESSSDVMSAEIGKPLPMPFTTVTMSGEQFSPV